MLHKAWNSKKEMPYSFPRSSIKFQGHTGQNITDFDPNWAFPDYRPVAAFKSLRFALFPCLWYPDICWVAVKYYLLWMLWMCFNPTEWGHSRQPNLLTPQNSLWGFLNIFYFMVTTLITRFMGPTWGPPGAARTQAGPMLATWTLLSG